MLRVSIPSFGMLNIYEAVRNNPSYSKLEIGDMLFAEYTCGVTETKLPNWTETDYLVHVVTGRKTWHTPDGALRACPGETLFFKKGATVVEQHFEEDVCLLMLFIPDVLMRSTVREVNEALRIQHTTGAPIKTGLRVETDVTLAALFQSMRTYLASAEKPPEPIVRLKFKELVISILTSGTNSELAEHFRKIGDSDSPSVAEIMEANFLYNLSLEEYAKMCHRSLSSFKREFQAHFRESPGKWLVQRRLVHGAMLLRTSKNSVTDIALDCGFENVSHFNRTFKERFGIPPTAYRKAPDVVV